LIKCNKTSTNYDIDHKKLMENTKNLYIGYKKTYWFRNFKSRNYLLQLWKKFKNKKLSLGQ